MSTKKTRTYSLTILSRGSNSRFAQITTTNMNELRKILCKKYKGCQVDVYGKTKFLGFMNVEVFGKGDYTWHTANGAWDVNPDTGRVIS